MSSINIWHSRREIHDGPYIPVRNNNWIRDCAGPWGSILLLVTKPQQASCVDIDEFVWRLCISYRPLNSVTRSFEFLITCCSDSIEDLGDSYRNLFFISLDACSDYHQIKVRPCDQEKLDFTPNGKHNFFYCNGFWTEERSRFLRRHDENSPGQMDYYF